MLYPNIKSYRDDIRSHFISPWTERPQFLGRNMLDRRWQKEPRVNLRKQDQIFEMQVTLPGFKKEDIDITITDDLLSIRAERKEEKKVNEYLLKEFDNDIMERTFTLAPDIGKEKVTAEYSNGILKICFIDVPIEEEMSSKKVTVE